jgi:hypothetical protein
VSAWQNRRSDEEKHVTLAAAQATPAAKLHVGNTTAASAVVL